MIICTMHICSMRVLCVYAKCIHSAYLYSAHILHICKIYIYGAAHILRICPIFCKFFCILHICKLSLSNKLHTCKLCAKYSQQYAQNECSIFVRVSSSTAYAKYERFTKLCFHAMTLNNRPFAIIAFLMFEENAFRVCC